MQDPHGKAKWLLRSIINEGGVTDSLKEENRFCTSVSNVLLSGCGYCLARLHGKCIQQEERCKYVRGQESLACMRIHVYMYTCIHVCMYACISMYAAVVTSVLRLCQANGRCPCNEEGKAPKQQCIKSTRH